MRAAGLDLQHPPVYNVGIRTTRRPALVKGGAVKRLIVWTVTLVCLAAAPPAAFAAAFPRTVPLPVDFQPEGIAAGRGHTFYAGNIRTGDVYRGDLRTGAGGVFVHAPAGRAAAGLKADVAHKLLFVAGAGTGAAYVYDLSSGAPVAAYQFPSAVFVNDVALTKHAAYFTETFAPRLYKVPIGRHGALGAAVVIPLSGPAAQTVAGFNLNGIAATRNGRTLMVNNTALGALFTVDPRTGASRAVGVDGLVPGTPDGLLLAGHTAWVVENGANTVVRVRLSHDLSRGTITRTITDPAFEFPTTAAKFGSRLALVNAKFDLGPPPPFGSGAPPGTPFEVVVVKA
jgi:sugar lactone lactonase YvrE